MIELNHLPISNSNRYEIITELFRSIFRSRNEIYSWGQMEKELKPAKGLVPWPIPALLIDLQPHFAAWYSWARTQCGVLSLVNRDDDNGGDNKDHQRQQQQFRTTSHKCHVPSPYKVNELWSLKNAMQHACKLSLDKSCTLRNWSSSLTSRNSSLSRNEQCEMIHYAKHDVLTVSYLIRPITERWTFEQIKSRKTNELFIAFDSVKLPRLSTTISKKKIKNIDVQKVAKIFGSIDSDIEPISDDEIYLHQLIEPVMNEHQGEDQIKQGDVMQDIIRTSNDDNAELQLEAQDDAIMTEDEQECVDNHDVVVNEVDHPPIQQQQQQKEKKRSREARKRKNYKRNMKLRANDINIHLQDLIITNANRK